MFRLWCEVYSADEATGYGLVDLISCTYDQKLDQAGAINVTLPATHPVAVEHMQVGRRIHIYWDRYGKRLIAKGVLLQQSVGNAGGSLVASWNATDSVEELRQVSTLRGLIYNNLPIADAVKDLVQRVGGWYVAVEAGVVGNTTQRFDGVSILQALNTIAVQHGYHFRLMGQQVLEFGEFGRDTNVRLVKAYQNQTDMPGIIAVTERLDIVTSGHEIVNWIEPISGPVDGGLTLKRATKNSPYAIETTTGPNGQIVYYLRDMVSISQYGLRQRVWSPEMLVAPVEATTTSLINAADVLYDAAVAFLQRHKAPQEAYTTSVRDFKGGVLIGDKVRLLYRGEVFQHGTTVKYIDVDKDFWVLGVSQRWGVEGYSVDWDIAAVDSLSKSPAELVAGIVRGQQLQAVQRQINVDRSEITDTSTVSKGGAVSVTFEVQNSTIDISSCRVRVNRTSWSTGGPYIFTVSLDGAEINGGPFLLNASASPSSFEINIADEIMDLSTIQGEHTLEISCLYGSGEIETRITLVETLLPGIGVPEDPFGDRSM